ncbi:MAG: hypothetical protein ACYCVH_15815 [Ignavibacteriaceae bacterium]
MPVQKFKSFDEASKALWNFNPGPDYYKKISAFYKLFFHLSRVRATHGIFKFRNQHEANKHRLMETKKIIENL